MTRFRQQYPQIRPFTSVVLGASLGYFGRLRVILGEKIGVFNNYLLKTGYELHV